MSRLMFFQSFSEENPGKFPTSVSETIDEKTEVNVKLVSSEIDIQSIFLICGYKIT